MLLYLSYAKAHTQHHHRYEVPKMRRQHFEETTAFQTSQPRGGGRHVCGIRHHDHGTRAQGRHLKTKALLAQRNHESVVW
jgi:hypothetical protein